MIEAEIEDDVKTEFADELTDEALDREEGVENSIMPMRCRCHRSDADGAKQK